MIVFAVIAFINAFLLFQVQFVIGKFILPWFGGVPAVWTTSMMFFQVLLLIGYALSGFASGERWRAKLGLLVPALAALSIVLLVHQYARRGVPVLPDPSFNSRGVDAPVFNIVVMLAGSVGLPYLTLAAASPQIQAWYYRFKKRPPYHLYSISNLGSLAGLLSYPFLVERVMDVQSQSRLWFFCFLLNGVLVSAAAATALAGRKARGPGEIHVPRRDQAQEGAASADARPSIRRRMLWIALSAVASLSLLANTNQICQEIAVVPFLWTLPLTLYLLSFILAFAQKSIYNREIFRTAFITLAFASGAALLMAKGIPVLWHVALFSCTLLVICMICHGELARLVPPPVSLASFYINIALGGAAGAVFVNLAAPLLFSGYWEFHLSILATAILLSGFILKEGRTEPSSENRAPSCSMRKAFAFSMPVLIAVFLLLSPLQYYRNSVASFRNFFGVLRVEKKTVERPESDIYFLMHGITTHGFQFAREDLRHIPTCYYGMQSGVGLSFTRHPNRASGETLKVGAIGLGIGTVAAYGEEGDIIDFYEINPKVADLAFGSGGYFDFLATSKARIGVETGDARVLIELELGGEKKRKHYDLLVLDAFSSDSVPVHLLTREAFVLYEEILKDDGIIAAHTSNRTLAIALQVLRQVFEEDYHAAVLITAGDDYSFGAEWVIATKNERFLSDPEIARNLIEPRLFMKKYSTSLWTDKHSSLFEILK
jgi:spermidine synthase